MDYKSLLSRISEDNVSSYQNYCKNYLISKYANKPCDEDLDIELIIIINKTNEIDSQYDDYTYYSDDEDYLPSYIEDKKNVFTKEDCKFCEQKNCIKYIKDESTMQCTNCGRDVKKMLEETAEWRNFDCDNSGESFVRCSTITDNYLNGSSTGTTIGIKGYNRLKQISTWISMTPKQRSKILVINKIKGYCIKGEFKKCTANDIISLFLELTNGTIDDDTTVIRGLNKITIAGYIAYCACKRNGEPRTPEEIVEIFEINIDDFTDAARSFNQLCKLKGKLYIVKPSAPSEFLQRLAPKIKNISTHNVEMAMKIANNAKKIGICTKHTPVSVAAASVMLMGQLTNMKLKSSEVSDVFRITTSTCDKVLEKLKKYAKIITNDETSDKVLKIINEKKNMPDL